MCGIFGMAVGHKAVYGKREKFVYNALEVGTLRGRDATGLFGVSNAHDRAEYVKLALPAPLFMGTQTANKFMRKAHVYDFLVGHHRAATRGGLDHESAHPYQFGDITLVHNGTLNTYQNLADGKLMRTDSEAIAYSINEHGAEETLKIVNGAFALLWHDAKTGSLYAARNNQRPLHFCTVVEDDTVFFASEAEMLRWIVERDLGAAYTIKDMYEVGTNRIIEFPYRKPGEWTAKEVQFYVPPKPKPLPPINGTGGNTTTKPGGKQGTFAELREEMIRLGYPKGKKVRFSISRFEPNPENHMRGTLWGITADLNAIEVKALNVHVGITDYEGQFFHTGKVTGFYYDEDGWPIITLKRVKETNDVDENPVFMTPEKAEEEDKQVKKLLHESAERSGSWSKRGTLHLVGDNSQPRTVTGPNGNEITLAAFDQLVKHGCSLCQKDLHPYMADTISWVDHNTPLCPACADEWDMAGRVH